MSSCFVFDSVCCLFCHCFSVLCVRVFVVFVVLFALVNVCFARLPFLCCCCVCFLSPPVVFLIMSFACFCSCDAFCVVCEVVFTIVCFVICFDLFSVVFVIAMVVPCFCFF